MSAPSRRSLVTSPATSLWPSGRPVWLIGLIGLSGGLAALAVPFLPPVLAEAGPPPTAPSAVMAQTPSEEPSTPAAMTRTTGTTEVTEAARAAETTRAAATTPPAPPKAAPSSTAARPPKTAAPERKTSTSRPPAATFAPVTINATDSANTRTDVQALDCPSCAAGSRIGYLAGASGLTVPVNGVAVAGTRTLTILYESDGPRDLYVSVNGGADQQLTGLRGRGNWETPAGTTLRITLRKGSNTLLFHNPVGPAPDLDQFRIR